jgi:hypothetical protein
LQDEGAARTGSPFLFSIETIARILSLMPPDGLRRPETVYGGGFPAPR